MRWGVALQGSHEHKVPQNHGAASPPMKDPAQFFFSVDLALFQAQDCDKIRQLLEYKLVFGRRDNGDRSHLEHDKIQLAANPQHRLPTDRPGAERAAGGQCMHFPRAIST